MAQIFVSTGNIQWNERYTPAKPVIYVHDSNNLVQVFGVRILGPSEVVYTPTGSTPGAHSRVHVQTDSPIELLDKCPEYSYSRTLDSTKSPIVKAKSIHILKEEARIIHSFLKLRLLDRSMQPDPSVLGIIGRLEHHFEDF